ncbi:hypothetical protein SAMN02910447_02783 [Ruminococcus sp. YE71]|uniref:hypothetical protein n=1 Tax=unclassified Ruminococcus TaxID=2608920 RepID=UPI0008825D3D|nr:MULTISPECIES: hypothetical protein [unclassified Ruminococcus]SDA27278.1 hypothetical protein SAMN02910446_02769 [Ruminococcus sp. YE78]SFW45286.1 hypothetical protein SAMN02910447_02783 [Ruminococcus sp. YE71]
MAFGGRQPEELRAEQLNKRINMIFGSVTAVLTAALIGVAVWLALRKDSGDLTADSGTEISAADSAEETAAQTGTMVTTIAIPMIEAPVESTEPPAETTAAAETSAAELTETEPPETELPEADVYEFLNSNNCVKCTTDGQTVIFEDAAKILIPDKPCFGKVTCDDRVKLPYYYKASDGSNFGSLMYVKVLRKPADKMLDFEKVCGYYMELNPYSPHDSEETDIAGRKWMIITCHEDGMDIITYLTEVKDLVIIGECTQQNDLEDAASYDLGYFLGHLVVS